MSNIRTKNGLTGLFAIILLLVSTSSVLAPALMLSSSHSGSARANSTIGNTAVSNRAVVFSPPLFASMTNEGAPYAGPNSVAALQSPLSADFIFPTTNQNIGPVNPTTGSPLAFNATVSGGSPPYAFDWNFTDGSLGTRPSLSHVFSLAGTYNVTLTVHDSTATSVIVSHLVSVVLASRVDFSYPVVSVNSPVAFNGTQGFYAYYWDFGDGSGTGGTSSFATVTHSYVAPGAYFVVLSAYNYTAGVYSTASHVLVVGSSVVAVDFSFPTNNVVVGSVTASTGSPVAFNATATGGTSPYNFAWNFGDGSLAAGNSPTHTFSAPGAYIVVLTTTDSSNVKATTSHFVVVQSTPRIDFVSFPTVTAGSPTVFNATTPGFSSYYWDFGDGTYSYPSSLASHTYSRSGTYFVVLSGYNNTGVYSTASHVVIVGAGVVAADFLYPTTSVIVGAVYPSSDSPVVFNATATGGVLPYTFTWDFGDGSTATGSTVTHVFSAAGIYIVVLTVTDAGGARAVASHFVNVVLAPPVDFSYPLVSMNSPAAFNAKQGFSSYYWDFGDGTYSYPSSLASHTYSRSGTYFVVLSAYNNTGVYSTASHIVVVGSGALAIDFSFPTSNIATGPVTASTGSPVAFNATATGGPSPYTFTWNFGDGLTASGNTATHVFFTAGAYTVVLTTTDAGGVIATASHYVIVVSTFHVDFSLHHVSTGSPTSFNATLGLSQYYWDFGDGGTYFNYGSSNGAFATHTYSRSGTYFVILTAYNNTGVYSTASHLLVVSSSVVAVDFSFPTYSVAVGPVTASTGSPVAFNVTSVQGGTPPYAFAWDFGDGNLAVGSSLTHTFTGPGIYTIVLTTTDSNNVKATASRFVLVQSTPRIDFVSFPTVTAGSPTVFNATTPGFSSYYWDFGDGTYSYPSSLASHTYSRSGTYFVVLSGYNASSYTGFYPTASHVLVVGSGVVAADLVYPTISVAVGPVYPSSGSPIVFNATATGGTSPYAFSWDFGDGLTSTGNTVTHVFSTGGTFTVVLTVSDASGAHAVASHFVLVQSAPRIDFVSYPTVTAGSPTVFNATLGFTYYYWDFGDGTSSSSGSLAFHTYSRSGTYFVVLSGYNASSYTGFYPTASHVLVVGSGVVAADFVYPTHNDGLTVSVNAGSPVVFNATAAGGSSPYQFDWILGDGSTAVGQLPTHIFASPGSYIVVLTVTDSQDNIAVAIHIVTVVSSPYLVDFTYPQVAPGSIVAFSGTSGFYYYYWDFGDGSTYQDYGSNGAAIAYHAYSRAGPFIVVMTVSDSLGTATASHGFGTALFSDFTVSPTTVTAGHPVSFNVTSVQGGTPPYTFAWNFGDGTTGSGTNPIHSYAKAGTFIIVLEITDASAPSANSLTIAHSITVVDFEITATPTVLYAIPGQSSNSTISVTSKLGFTGPVVLTAVTSPQPGLTCTITPGTVNLGTSEIAVLSCKGSVVTGFTVTVTGSASSGSHSVTITFYVTDFSIGASPTTITFDNGSSGDSTVYVSSIDGFSDPVTLSSTISPSGLACTIVPDIVTPYVYYYTTSALSCSSSIAGTYSVNVTGSSGSLTHSVLVIVNVLLVNFDMSASPTAVTIVSGSSANSTITLGVINGFTGNVTLSAAIYPLGPNVSLLDSSLTLGVTNSTVLTVSTGLGGAGDYTVTVTGVSGQLSHSVTIIVHAQDFAISPSQVTIEPGASGTSSVVVYSLNGFAGNVRLTATSSQGSANGITLSLSTENVTVNSYSAGYSILTIATLASTPSGFYDITITGTFGTLSHTTILTVQVSTPSPEFTIIANPAVITANVGTIANSTITIFPLNGFTDAVTLSTVITPSSGLNCTLTPGIITGGSGSSTLSCTGTLGNYVVTVTGTSGALSHYATVYFTYTVQDFTITASPTVVAVNVGQAGNATITMAAVNGFADVVNLTVDTSGCILDPTGVTGSVAYSKLSCTFASAGSFNVTVTGTSTNPSLSHSVTVNYIVGVPEFAITANPITIAVNAGIAAQSIITVSQINGFTGNVTLTVSISPSTGGLTCTLTVPSVLLGQSGTSSLSCYGSAGVYTVTITGTSDLLSHSATVIYTVQDFRISANPSTVNADVNQTATSTITITSLDFFHGIVTLTNDNAACTLTPTIITGSGTSMLSCTFTSVGSFNVVVNGTSDTLSRAITVTYIVAVSGFTTIGISCDTIVVVNQASVCTATVTDTTTTGPTSPTGTVTFTLNPSPGGGNFDSPTCILSPSTVGVSSCSVHFTGSGPGGDVVSLVASYGGDTTHAGSSSVVLSFGILGRSTTTTITCDSPVIVVTPSVCHIITTDISPGTPITPTGDFALTTNSSGTFDHNCMLDGTGATATCTVTYTPTVTGFHTITASYPQNSVDTYNTPSSFLITVNPPVLHTTITTVACTPSTTVLLGQNFGCTSTVTDQSPSPTTPTGTVTFTGGATCSLGGNTATATCTGTITGQTIGPLSITANYPGDIDHAASSGTTSVTIVARPTTTTLTCLPASVDIGTATSCTATVTDSSGIGTAITPTGTVDFTTNATGTFATLPCTLAEGTTAGIASCSVSYTPSGTTARTDMITATYVTDTSHTASSDAFSLTVTMQVQAHQTSTSISCLLNTVVINQVTPCTATVTDTSAAPTNPTGNVSFSSDSTGSFIPDTANCMLTPVGANVASCSISYVPSAMGTGTHTISATYSGDSSHVSSLGQTTVTVNKRPTSTTITSCTPASINFGSATMCTALVNDTDIGIGIIPTGTVAFTSSGPGTFIGSPCTLSQQVATCQVTYTPTGTTARTDTITASYSGDASHDTSTGTFPVNVETVPLDTTTTTVSCTPNPVTIDQLSTCTATVTDTIAAPTTPTGTMSFTPGGVCTLAGVNSSSATCSISIVPVASGTIDVSTLYSGDHTHSTSSGVTALATSLRMPTVTVACTPPSVAVNQATACTATVADGAAGTASIPTGTVTFAPGGTCTLSHSNSDPNPDSTCSITITPTATGQLSISATYSGDSTHSGSQGSTTINVTPAILNSTNTSISCVPNTVTISSPTTCTVTVTDTSPSGATTPTGTVGFTTNSTGTFTPASATCTLAAGTIVATASCNISYTPTVTGHHLITSSYNGDPTHSGSTGSFNLAVSSTVPPSLHSTKTLVSCSQGSVLVNAPTTCTAKVTDNSTSPTVPTGTVTFTTNSAGTFNPASATCTLAAGNAPKMATCSVSYTPTVTGKQLITGSYGGDSSHAKSSGGFAVNVRPPPSGSTLSTFRSFQLDELITKSAS